MLNSDGIENNKKNNFNKNRSNQPKKKTLHMQHTFFVHFFTFVVARLQREAFQFTKYTFYGGNVVCSHKKKNIAACVTCSLSFALPLIFILLAANIPHFLTTAIKFSCFCSKICLLCFYLWLLLFPCYPSQPRH